jgi:hypothetical protein
MVRSKLSKCALRPRTVVREPFWQSLCARQSSRCSIGGSENPGAEAAPGPQQLAPERSERVELNDYQAMR